MKMLILIIMPIFALVAQGELNVYELISNAEDVEREYAKRQARLTVANFVIYHDQCAPTAGEFYEMGEAYLRILQVFSDGILVWPTENIVADMPRNTWTPVFIKMQDTRSLRAGENPPWGVVKATGAQASYTSILGRHNTVDVFVALGSADAAAWKFKIKKAQENDYQSRNENQIAFRKAFAEKLFSSLEFDLSKRIMVDKAVAPYADQIKVEVKHFAWEELRRKCVAKDWLGALNISYDIGADNGGLTYHYKDYPELTVISQIFIGIKEKQFINNVEVQLPKDVKCEIIRINNRREWNTQCMGRFEMGEDATPMMKYELHKVFVDVLPFEATYIGGHRDVAFADETIIIGEEMSLDQLLGVDNEEQEKGLSEFNKQMRRLRVEAGKIGEEYKKRRISVEDHNLRMQEINKKFNTLISSNFFSLHDQAAIEKAKRERQADLEREQQELKLKTEETERKRQAELKLKLEAERQELDKYTSEIFKKIQTLPLSFDIADHLIVQKALIPYIHSIVITERDWEELSQLHESGDYMGLLKAVAKRNNVAMDETRKGDLEKAVKMLERMSFHVQIEFTCRMCLYHGTLAKGSWNGGKLYSLRSYGFERNLSEIVLVLEVRNTSPTFLYNEAASWGDSLEQVKYFEKGEQPASRDAADKCKDVLSHMTSEMKSVRSLKTADERMAARKNLLDKYKGIFLIGLCQRMDKIIGTDTTQGQSTASMNGGHNVAAGASSNYQKCTDCDGAKYIKEEAVCDQCNGHGQIEKVKLGLNGTSRRVISKCANCNGTGVATKKTPCATCKGKGKIRVK